MAARWEHFHHVADVGVRGFGRTLDEAFEGAATALTAVLVDPATIAARETVPIACEARDPELLLVEWLNAIVYEMATRRMLFREFHVRIDGIGGDRRADAIRLQASAIGDTVDVPAHAPAVEVKGATYTELLVRREESGEWRAQTVVDV